MTALSITLPTVGGSEDTWGTTLNADLQALSDFIGLLDSTELAVLDGITATTAQLNATATFTAAGLALMDDVDAAAQRTTLGLGTAATTAATDYATAAQGVLADTALQSFTVPASANADFAVDPTLFATRATIKTLVVAAGIGAGQTWANLTGSRAIATSYQNTTGKPIQVLIQTDVNVAGDFQVSPNNSTWTTVYDSVGSSGDTNVISVIVPNLIYYKLLSSDNLKSWAELR